MPTWDALIADARSGPGTDERHEVGAWAMEQVWSALGEGWPCRWHERVGQLPAFVGDPATHAYAYAQLAETGLRLHSLAGTLRLPRLTRVWARDAELIWMFHTLMQLEVAALARAAGAVVEFEAPVNLPVTSRAADVLISAANGQLIAECFCVYNDYRTSEAMAYDRQSCRPSRSASSRIYGQRDHAGHTPGARSAQPPAPAPAPP